MLPLRELYYCRLRLRLQSPVQEYLMDRHREPPVVIVDEVGLDGDSRTFEPGPGLSRKC